MKIIPLKKNVKTYSFRKDGREQNNNLSKGVSGVCGQAVSTIIAKKHIKEEKT